MARLSFGVVGVAFMVIAFWHTWDEADRALLPPWPILVAAVAMLMAGLTLAGVAWIRLIERPFGRRVLAGFVIAQLGKYIPGAVWQAVGQVGHAIHSRVSPGGAAVAFIVFALVQIAVGGVLGSAFGALGAGSPGILRIASLGGVGLLILLRRPVLVAVVNWFTKRRGVEGRDLVPPSSAIRAASLLNLGAVVLVCATFALVITHLSEASFLEGLTAFALAWTAGLVVVPVPAGLGVREAVLIAALGHAAPTGSLIAASVYLRLGFVIAEGLVILIALLPSAGQSPDPLD